MSKGFTKESTQRSLRILRMLLGKKEKYFKQKALGRNKCPKQISEGL
jgi:hypothetical protein